MSKLKIYILYLSIIILIALTIKFLIINNFKIDESGEIGNKIMNKINNKFFNISWDPTTWSPSSKTWYNKNPSDYSKFWEKNSKFISNEIINNIKPDNSFSN